MKVQRKDTGSRKISAGWGVEADEYQGIDTVSHKETPMKKLPGSLLFCNTIQIHVKKHRYLACW